LARAAGAAIEVMDASLLEHFRSQENVLFKAGISISLSLFHSDNSDEWRQWSKRRTTGFLAYATASSNQKVLPTLTLMCVKGIPIFMSCP
jgi:hypothetical protein